MQENTIHKSSNIKERIRNKQNKMDKFIENNDTKGVLIT